MSNSRSTAQAPPLGSLFGGPAPTTAAASGPTVTPAPPPGPPAALAPFQGPPPPGPQNRVRPVTTIGGDRIPYTRAELAGIFNADLLREVIFENLGVPDALSLREGVHARQSIGRSLGVEDYVKCTPATCEDHDVTLLPARPWPWQHLDHAPAPLPFEPQNSVMAACGREAKWMNASSVVVADADGKNELSMCRESPNLHSNGRHRLVCEHCKDERNIDLYFRQYELLYGVCGVCSRWADGAHGRNKLLCDCEVFNWWDNGVNDNDLRAQHLCREHDQHF